MKHYDYIIAGAGCAGLSLLTRIIESGKFRDKKILLVDKAPKDTNDRTWCFWETTPGFFEPVVQKRWQQLYFHSPQHSLLMDIAPYVYKMIRSIDFYNYCFKQITEAGIEVQYATIGAVASNSDYATIEIGNEISTADYVFSSVMPESMNRQPGRHYLLQHFKGWLVEMNAPCFDADIATMMDFRVTQQHGDCFIYLLPLTPTRAMVECTFFSKEVQSQKVYEHILRNYLLSYFPEQSYDIVEEEYGVIPMTDHRFKKDDGRIIYLGTAGGNTKGSSGYTFQFIQQHSAALVQQLAAIGTPYLHKRQPQRFSYYDTILLHVLEKGDIKAAEIFRQLFMKNDARTVLKFLDNQSSRREDLSIISSLPTAPFLAAALRELNFLKKAGTKFAGA